MKKKWANCYMKNNFTLGVQSTPLSESLNRDLKAYLKSDLAKYYMKNTFWSKVWAKCYMDSVQFFNILNGWVSKNDIES